MASSEDDVIPFGTSSKIPKATAPASIKVNPNANDIIPFGITNPSPVPTGSPEQPDDNRNALMEAASLGYPLVPALTGLIGGFLGGPPGAIAGAGIGGGLAKNIEQYGKYGIKAPAVSPQEQLKGALLNAGLEAGGQALAPVVGWGISKATGPVKNAIVKKLFSSENPVNIEQTVAALDRGYQPTVGQAGNKTAAFLERTVGSSAKQARELEQAGKVRTDIATEGEILRGADIPLTKQQYGQQGQQAITENIKNAADIRRRFYQNFEKQHVDPNTVTIPRIEGYQTSAVVGPSGQQITTPVIKNVAVRGPIYTTEASKIAADLQPEINALVSDDKLTALFPQQQAQLRNLRQAVNDLATGTKVSVNGQEANIPLKEWDTVKRIITSINKGGNNEYLSPYEKTMMKRLGAALDDDMSASMAKWSDPVKAQLDYNKAKLAYANEKQTFGSIARNVFKKGDVRELNDASELFQDAYKSPESVQRYQAALGKESKLLKGDYFDNHIVPKIMDHATGKMDFDAAIREFTDPNSITQKIYSNPERGRLVQFFKAARAVSPDTSDLGKVALAFRDGYFILNLARPIAQKALTVQVGAKNFVEKVLLDPHYAAVATRALKVPPTSAEGAARSKAILLAMKGLEVKVNLPDGSQKDGVISDSGNPKY